MNLNDHEGKLVFDLQCDIIDKVAKFVSKNKMSEKTFNFVLSAFVFSICNFLIGCSIEEKYIKEFAEEFKAHLENCYQKIHEKKTAPH